MYSKKTQSRQKMASNTPLLSKSARVNRISEYFGTPLQAAAGRGDQEMVLYLLKLGANARYLCRYDVPFRPEAYREEDMALRSATRRDFITGVRLFLNPVKI